MTQNTSHAVMAQRAEPHDSLDFFPTPPWATRALCAFLLGEFSEPLSAIAAWEPACGEGHMSRALSEYFGRVESTDVHPYGFGDIADFLFPGTNWQEDWIITNPPFRLAESFAARALELSKRGVALLVRSVFLEGGQRWRDLYSKYPPTDVLVFCERVPMLKGVLDRNASSATSYSWFVWRHVSRGNLVAPRLRWIPPGTRKRLERDDDYPIPEAA